MTKIDKDIIHFRVEKIHDIIKNDLSDFDEFVAEILKFLQKKSRSV